MLYQHVLSLAEGIEDAPKQADALESLGWVSYQMGLPERAISCYEQACILYKAISLPESLANLTVQDE